MTPQKKVLRASYVWWAGTVVTFLTGEILVIVWIISELHFKNAVGGALVVVSTISFSVAGIFATIAASMEAKENRKNTNEES